MYAYSGSCGKNVGEEELRQHGWGRNEFLELRCARQIILQVCTPWTALVTGSRTPKPTAAGFVLNYIRRMIVCSRKLHGSLLSRRPTLPHCTPEEM